MIFKKECKVQMLPTNGRSHIYHIKKKNQIGWVSGKHPEDLEQFPQKVIETQNQHLYILSNDKMSVGDWFLEGDGDNIKPRQINTIALLEDLYDYEKERKIIATTNEELLLPRIPQDFIEDFIICYNNWNPIEEAFVEYEQYISSNPVWDPNNPYSNVIVRELVNPKYKTISISKIKKRWNREEVECLFDKFIEDTRTNSTFFNKYGDMPGGMPALYNKWKEENI